VRVLLINNLFDPEPNHLRGLAFARELQRRGHDVHVLTGFPNYPGGKIYAGYRLRWSLREELDGVPVTRVLMYPSHDGSGVRRAMSYVSIAASQAVHALTARQRFDIAHVYMGPITLIWPAAMLRALRGTKIVADVQDIWPESVTDSGMLRSRSAGRLLSALSARAYRAADRLIALSPGYKRALEERGVRPESVDVVYNWCDERRSQNGMDAAAGVLEPGTFTVVYAGNIGKLQGIDAILDAAARVQAAGRLIRFVIIGDGVDADRIRARVRDENIANVHLAGRLPVGVVNAILPRADLLLIHLLPSGLTRIGIPQKVQAYLASGTPVLIAAAGDSAELVTRSGGGVTCRPGDPQAMASEICRLADMDPNARRKIGEDGARYYRDELAFAAGVSKIETVYEKAVAA
jgi:colanic acid biosynthesis glycosyl transferase WcaI